jgi:hypothetical protein
MSAILSTIKANHERPDLIINATLITFASSIEMVTEEVDRNTCIYRRNFYLFYYSLAGLSFATEVVVVEGFIIKIMHYIAHQASLIKSCQHSHIFVAIIGQ